MTKNISIAQAKAQLSGYIRDVEQGEPILITRHGKPVVALVAAQHLEHLERLRKAGPLRGLASLAGGWDGADELVHHIEHASRTVPRSIDELE